MSVSLIIFLGLLFAQGGGEYVAMKRTGTLWRKHKREWTYYTVVIPYKAMLAASIFEHISFHTQPSLPAIVVGSCLAIGGIIIRVRGHLELDGAFSPYVEKSPGQKIVTSGLYKRIRHPMYLGTILLFVSMPLIVSANWAWIFSVLSVIGIIVRIQKEEAFLSSEFAGYKEYAEKTWRLLPHIY
jgi:protein-S-isoprenylcysteine O-methyltransferase Ste14